MKKKKRIRQLEKKMSELEARIQTQTSTKELINIIDQSVKKLEYEIKDGELISDINHLYVSRHNFRQATNGTQKLDSCKQI